MNYLLVTYRNPRPRFKVQPNGCWDWQCNVVGGYAHIHWRGKERIATRVYYEQVYGDLPADAQIDHLCRNPRCVNPSHLEAVSRAENMRRTRGTHCKKGHPMTGDNIRIRHRAQREERVCRACHKVATREAWRAAHPGAKRRV